MTLLVQAANISYAHGGNHIFTGMSFTIHSGDRLALIGENGSGKSTLFGLLTRRKAFSQGGKVALMRCRAIGASLERRQAARRPRRSVRTV